MKKYITVFFLTSCFLSGLAQSIPQKFEEIDTSKFSKKYYHLKSLFESLPNKKKVSMIQTDRPQLLLDYLQSVDQH